MKKNENTVKVHEPFSPTIVETQVPKKFIDIINTVGDEILNVLGSGIAVLGSDKSDKPIVVIVVTNDIIDKGINAGNLAKIIGNEMGGGGGGKPSLATAGGKDLNTYALAMKKSIDLIKSELKEVEG